MYVDLFWSSLYINNIQINFFLMLIDFTEHELETIAAAMDDYIAYAEDEFASSEDLIGGIPVAERVDSILEKITNVLCQ